MRTTTGAGARTAGRHQVLTALAGVAVLGLAACGSAAPSSTAAGASSTKALGTPAVAGSGGASGAAASASSAKPSSSYAGTTSFARLALRVASAAKAKGTARVVTSSSSTGQRATGFMRFRGSGIDFAITTPLPGGRTLKMLVVGGVAYMNLGEKYQGKNWVRIAPGGSDPVSKALGPLLTQLSTGMDPQTQLVGAKDSRITATARTALRGVPATKYTVVSTEKALTAQLERFAPTPELRKAVSEQLAGAHSEAALWIGDDGVPLRVDSSVVGGKAPATTTSVTYSDWGKPVSISAPARSDTVDLAR